MTEEKKMTPEEATKRLLALDWRNPKLEEVKALIDAKADVNAH